ncbi:MAG TPA: CPBP family intramembrane metalloprotease [Spirochaetota bacterium]|nr:CPBP family intramembrane metalloprotease [Spirochaetota bacterium]HPQ52934.1 CPBP family intramembrane metalloprotease [Spirochaetota bacterium]
MIYLSELWHEIKSDMSSLGWREPLLVIVASICIFVSMGMQGVFSSVKYINLLWAPFDPLHLQFYAYVNWFLNYFVLYLLVPLFFVCVFYRCRLSFFGFGAGSLRRYMPLYGMLLLLMVPVVVISSLSRDFSMMYPLMQVPVLHLIIIWEILYMLQFVAVEFLFRGFLLFPFCEKYGTAGILFSVIPYCIIHLGKPVPEAMGAVITGVILGYLAWKSKSIWGGVLLHGIIALLMDMLALLNR